MSRRVGIVVTTTSTERGEVLATGLLGLLEAGWDARLFCKGESWAGDPALRDPALTERVEFSPAQGRFPPPAALRRRPGELARYLRDGGKTGPFDQRLLEMRPDVIHFHSGSGARKGMRLKGILGCRVVVSLRADGQDLLQAADRELLWEADLILFPDRAALRRAASLGCPLDRAEVLPPPLSPRGGRGTGAMRALSAGPVTWEQGFEHSVHAVRLVLDMGIGCEYRIVGEGEHLLAVAFARHQLDLAEHVELLSPDGGAPAMDAFRDADVFVDPAVSDRRPGTALEMAQAFGIPFVATGRGGLHEDAGIAVPRRNARAIADALATLATEPDMRIRMGEAAQARAGDYPTLEQHALRLEALYRRVLA